MTLVRLNKDYLQFPIPEFDYGDCVLAGGAIRDSIQGIEYKDLDIFGPSEASLLDFAERNLTPNGYNKVYTSKWAHTFIREGVSQSAQLVFGRPINPKHFDTRRTGAEDGYAQLLSEFPFTINQFLFNGESIYCTGEAIADTLLRLIRINTLDKPDIFDTLRRVERYKKRGYTEIEGTTQEIINFIGSLTATEYEQYSVRPSGFAGGAY